MVGRLQCLGGAGMQPARGAGESGIDQRRVRRRPAVYKTATPQTCRPRGSRGSEDVRHMTHHDH